MDDLVTRYGYTYYSVRFGLLAPSELLIGLAGPLFGYFLLRWLLMTGLSALVMIWGKRTRGYLLGVLGCAIILLSPVTHRAVMTIYSDTVGVPYVAGATVLLLLPGSARARIMYTLAAGGLIGLTINSNLVIALPLAVSLLAWFVVRIMTTRSRQAVWEALAVAGGAILVTLLGALLYLVRFGRANIISPSIDAARRISDVVTADRAPTREWLLFRPYLFLPLIAIVALGVTLAAARQRPRWQESALVGMLVGAGAFYLFEEFILEGYLLETYFYTSYFLGPTVLLMLYVVDRVGRLTGRATAVTGGVAGVGPARTARS